MAADLLRHARGAQARVLLCSVFGPYARDDGHGSRRLSPMELYQSQVTREQGAFSLRMFHRSWGLMLIQANLRASCTVLDFPTLERFTAELRGRDYDVVGIGAIPPNIAKVASMCALVRRLQPRATIVVGGHVASHPRIGERVDADHVVRGEGVRWFRRFLGEDESAPLNHPLIVSGFGTRVLGVDAGDRPRDTAATVIPSVGCPLGCDFCATSAMFGGKGRSVAFFHGAEELFEVMCRLEQAMGVRSFFVMDENFLLDKRRALRLLELMRAEDRSWTLAVFSSANALRLFTLEQLVGLGLSWVWLGLEGEDAGYAKLKGIDTRGLVRGLQAHGVRVLGSTIIGLPEHTPENIDRAIDHAVAHDTDFHQFMLYTPVPGTPLHARHAAAGTLLAETDDADVHGQLRFNFRHPHIPAGAETGMLVRAFRRDLEVNGPSIARLARTMLLGWRRHRHDPDLRVRRRYEWECRSLATTYAGLVWAARQAFAGNPALRARLDALQRDLAETFGWRARVAAPAVGSVLSVTRRLEEARLRRGRADEPPTFYETNRPEEARAHGPALARWVERVAPG
jgi:radical SAM superfamily enzyme YgiQ (UPF0313 family)